MEKEQYEDHTEENYYDLLTKFKAQRARLAEAEREHAAELENVELLTSAIGKLSMKVLGREDYACYSTELLTQIEDYIDAANARVAKLEEALNRFLEHENISDWAGHLGDHARAALDGAKEDGDAR